MTEFSHTDTVALADAARALIDAIRLADAPIDVLTRARVAVETATRELTPHRHLGQVAQAALDGAAISERGELHGPPSEFFPYSPIVGPRNPIAPPVLMWPDDAFHLHGLVTLGAAYSGPPGLVHGGVIALIFDELLGACAVINDCAGFTGTLTVKYLRGTPIRTSITMEAWIDRVEGRKTFVTGELRYGGSATASATGIFISAAAPLP